MGDPLVPAHFCELVDALVYFTLGNVSRGHEKDLKGYLSGLLRYEGLELFLQRRSDSGRRIVRWSVPGWLRRASDLRRTCWTWRDNRRRRRIPESETVGNGINMLYARSGAS
jgi:hypothetical protein